MSLFVFIIDFATADSVRFAVICRAEEVLHLTHARHF